MKVRSWSFNLPFKYPFSTAHGTKTHQPTFVVELEHLGMKGYGEAPAITYYHIPVEKMQSDLDSKKTFVEKYALTTPDRYWHYLHHLFPQNSFLVCALDIAAWDLYGKLQRKPLYEIWKLDKDKTPLTDYTIGMDTIPAMLAKIDAMPWPIYKIKLGSDKDLEIVRAIRERTDAAIRVDANAGWSLDDAIQRSSWLSAQKIEFIEQPLAKDAFDDMKILSEKSDALFIADESCVSEQDVEKCAGKFGGINIKLTKCGGITPALRMIESARSLGLKVMAGSMNESTVGSAAIAHLLPLLDFVDMDGPLLLQQDIATGLSLNFGKVTIPSSPGLGINFEHSPFPINL